MSEIRDPIPPGHGELPVGAVPSAETLRQGDETRRSAGRADAVLPALLLPARPGRGVPEMSADVEIRTDSELMVAGVQGLTDAGVDFVEAIVDPIRVEDADRVVVKASAVPGIEREATVVGLTVDRRVVTRLARTISPEDLR